MPARTVEKIATTCAILKSAEAPRYLTRPDVIINVVKHSVPVLTVANKSTTY